MIYFYYGTDSEKARKKAQVSVDALVAKKPDASLVKISDEEIAEEKIQELVSGQGLFENKYIIFFKKSFENKENKEKILKYIKEIGKSENIFIFAEGKMDKASLAKIEKNSAKVENFEKAEKKILTKKEKLASIGEKVDFFEFTDAFGARNKKGLWVLYQDALKEQVPSEEIHGMFFWQMKSMMMASSTESANEAGMNPYPYQKAKGYARNFSDSELKNFSLQLVAMYHEAHRGNLDFAVALEKFILEL